METTTFEMATNTSGTGQDRTQENKKSHMDEVNDVSVCGLYVCAWVP